MEMEDKKDPMAVWKKKTSILNNFITMVNTIMKVVELPLSTICQAEMELTSKWI